MSIFIFFVIYQDHAIGGHEWKQGDWLINDLGIAVRRGTMGSAILRFSAATSLDPIFVVTSLQASLFGLCIVLLGRSINRSSSPGTLWLLILSPAFFVNFWSVDPDGALRKELVIFLAFTLMFYGTTLKTVSKPLVVLSALVFAIAVFSHEGNVFFAPFFIFCYFLIFQKGHISKPLVVILSSVILTSVIGAILLALNYSGVEDHRLVCQPLLDAGVRPGICDGAITALELDLGFFLEATFWMLLSPKVLSFLLMYVLAAISILAIGFHFFDKKPLFLGAVCSAFFYLPLYVVAVDWGRWLSFHAAAVIFVMLIVLSLDREKWKNAPELQPGPFIALTIFSVIWGCSHFVDVKWGGILVKTLTGIASAV